MDIFNSEEKLHRLFVYIFDLQFDGKRRRKMSKKRSEIWRYFSESSNSRKVTCDLCKIEVSQGADNGKSKSTTPLTRHLEKAHKKEFAEFEKLQNAKKQKLETNDDGQTKLFNCRTKQERKQMLQTTIGESFDRGKMYELNSDQAQKYHRKVFEMMILDLRPFNCVNNPGFIRLCFEFDRRFDLASETYYRNLLSPTFEKIKKALKKLVQDDNPITFVITTDLWSAYHHSYLGINVHYLRKFKRVKFNLACLCMDIAHTGENIRNEIVQKLIEWNIEEKVSLCIRDNAANMIKAFEHNNPSPSVGCLAHTLQLVINDKIFTLVSVEKLIKKCRNLSKHANQSNVFYNELYNQERLQMNLAKEVRLKQDVVTRWNSTHDMMARMLYLKPALVTTLSNLPDVGIEFVNNEWNLMEKVVKTLESFENATKKLSKNEACISQVIPFVSTILKQLEITRGDHGVITYKQALIDGMLDRFQYIETQEEYTFATLLDIRFKGHVFRDKTALKSAKERLQEKLEQMLMIDALGENDDETNQPNPTNEKSTFDRTMESIIKKSQSSKDSQANTIQGEVKVFFETYLNSPVEEDPEDYSKVSQYWQHMSESSKPLHQKLAEIASIYLTPPPTSVDVERLFSTTGDILTKERNLLNPNTVDKILFCRANMENLEFKY